MSIKSLLPGRYDPAGSLDWRSEKCKDIQMRFQENIGRPPFARKTRRIEMIETIECENYECQKLRYLVGDFEEIRAYLLVPQVGNKEPGFPAILACIR